MEKLIAMLKKAYALAGQVVDDNRDEQVLQVLAEEVSGECGEFIAILSEDYGSFGDTECMDFELVELAEKIKGRAPIFDAVDLLDQATTIIYNTEGDLYQEVYEQLEVIVQKLKGV